MKKFLSLAVFAFTFVGSVSAARNLQPEGRPIWGGEELRVEGRPIWGGEELRIEGRPIWGGEEL